MKPIKCIYGCNHNMKCVNVVEDAKSQSESRYTKHYVCEWCKGKLSRKGVELE